MKSEELCKKLREITDAVRKVPGIQITSVDTGIDIDRVYLVGEMVPKILTMELIVKIGLKLEAEEVT